MRCISFPSEAWTRCGKAEPWRVSHAVMGQPAQDLETSQIGQPDGKLARTREPENSAVLLSLPLC